MSHVIAPRFIGPALDDGGYQVEYSCRFNDNDSAYLSRTPGSPGNRRTFTLSGWVKRGNLGSYQSIWSAGKTVNDSDYFSVEFTPSDKLHIDERQSITFVTALQTTMLFRDPSAWYHIAVAFDTTKPTPSDRVKLYVNGEQVTAFDSATYQNQNTDTWWNSTEPHRIGQRANSGGGGFADYYLSQATAIDGQALPVTDFGEFDSHGVWRPIDVSGLTFGTNGFLLDFAIDSNLGNDVSGNNNDFTSSGLTTADQVMDTPTTNWSVLNPLDKHPDFTLSDGNLRAISGAGANNAVVRATIFFDAATTVGYYWEAQFLSTANGLSGVETNIVPLDNWGTAGESWALNYNNGDKISGTSQSYGSSCLSGSDIVMHAVRDGKLWWGKNGTWFASGDPAAGTNPAYSSLSGKIVAPFIADGSSGSGTNFLMNFGQHAFTYTPPSGFEALATATLPKPASAGSVTPITGSFTGNGNADGPFVWLGYTPNTTTTSTINGNTIDWDTDARPTAGGFKVITSSSSYNNNGVSNSYSIAVNHPFGGEDVTPMTAR